MLHLMTFVPPATLHIPYIQGYRESFISAGEKHIHGAEGLIHYPDIQAWIDTRILSNNNSLVLCSLVRDVMVGTLRVTPYPTEEQLETGSYNIGQSIRPDARGVGYGTLQLTAGINILRMLGVEAPMCSIRLTNASSIRVAEKTGATRLREEGDSAVYQWL